MKAGQLEHLGEHLQPLRLFQSRERLKALLQEASIKELSHADFLDTVLGEEVAAKTAKNITRRTTGPASLSSRDWMPSTSATRPRWTGTRSTRSPPAISSSMERMW